MMTLSSTNQQRLGPTSDTHVRRWRRQSGNQIEQVEDSVQRFEELESAAHQSLFFWEALNCDPAGRAC